MKANELMVGDWVLNRKKFSEVKPIRLTQVDFCLWKADGIYAKDYLDCDPIPLTPEILEKNGWTLWEIEGEYKGVISIYGREAPFGVFDGIEINFVHQLQHALRLCGINKTIEL